MLRWRLVSAAVLISVLLALLFLDFHHPVAGRPGLWLLPVALGFLSLGVLEMFDLLAAQQWQPRRTLTLIATLLPVVAAAAPALWREYPADCPLGRLGWPLLATLAAVGLVFLGEMHRFREPGKTTVHVALSVLTIVYLGLGGSFLVQLRLFHSNAWGLIALISTILVTKMADTGAYFTGRLIGRHKMAPILSPKKTIEGGVGGVVASMLSAWLFLTYFPGVLIPNATPPETWQSLVYGLALAVAGTAGDLAESLIKRDVGIKDASRRLPGLGGVLDVLDSLLFAAPVAYAMWVLVLKG